MSKSDRHITKKELPAGADRKESACNAGDPGSTPGSGRAPGEGHGYPLQYSQLENSHGEESGGWGVTARYSP